MSKQDEQKRVVIGIQAGSDPADTTYVKWHETDPQEIAKRKQEGKDFIEALEAGIKREEKRRQDELDSKVKALKEEDNRREALIKAHQMADITKTR